MLIVLASTEHITFDVCLVQYSQSSQTRVKITFARNCPPLLRGPEVPSGANYLCECFTKLWIGASHISGTDNLPYISVVPLRPIENRLSG